MYQTIATSFSRIVGHDPGEPPDVASPHHRPQHGQQHPQGGGEGALATQQTQINLLAS